MSPFWEILATPMEPPGSYTRFHFLTVVIGAVLIILLTRLLANGSERRVRTVLLVTGLFLLATEILKQFFFHYVIDPEHYSWYVFPFQYCSAPMYLCLLTGFLKPSRLRQALMTYLGSFGLLGGMISFAEPSGIFQSYVFLTIHSIVWHHLLVFVGVFLGANKMVGKEQGEFLPAAKVFMVLSTLAFSLNLFFWEASRGAINNFFIGPAISPLAVYKTIAQRYGWRVNTVLFMMSVTLGAYLVFRAQMVWRAKRSKDGALGDTLQQKQTHAH